MLAFRPVCFRVIAQTDNLRVSKGNADLFLNFTDSAGFKGFTGINMSPKMDQYGACLPLRLPSSTSPLLLTITTGTNDD